jgi:hypothetical protein
MAAEAVVAMAAVVVIINQGKQVDKRQRSGNCQTFFITGKCRQSVYD